MTTLLTTIKQSTTGFFFLLWMHQQRVADEVSYLREANGGELPPPCASPVDDADFGIDYLDSLPNTPQYLAFLRSLPRV